MFFNRLLKLTCAAAAVAAIAAPAALAETKVDLTLTVANPSPISETHQASLAIRNTSTGLDAPGHVTILSNSIQWTPSCSTVSYPCAAGDPYVFFPFSPAHGRAGTACEGTSYMVIGNHPSSGRYLFATTRTNVLDPPGGPMDTCIIDFDYYADKMPRTDIDPAAPGIQTHMLTDVTTENELTPIDTYDDGGDTIVTVPDPAPAPVEPEKKKCKKKKGDKKKASRRAHTSKKKKKKKCKKKHGKGKKD